MSKSVLVIDTPERCEDCMLCYDRIGCYISIGTYPLSENCPLSPLPQYRPVNEYIQRGDARSMTHLITSIHDIGYNECLDEILKGKRKC